MCVGIVLGACMCVCVLRAYVCACARKCVFVWERVTGDVRLCVRVCVFGELEHVCLHRSLSPCIEMFVSYFTPQQPSPPVASRISEQTLNKKSFHRGNFVGFESFGASVVVA